MIDLFDEEILKPKKKKTIKPITIILVAIAILVILFIVTMVSMVYLRSKILKITVDGNDAKDLEEIFIIEENSKIYIPIRRMAEYLNYDSYNGDYITRSEDATKCYIETEEELVSFTLNSNILTKVVDGQTQQIKITEPIKEINGELCINAEGTQDAFNFRFNYNVEKNDIYIETLPYLYNWYSQTYQAQGFLPIDIETFANKTAIWDGMLIVKSDNQNYGVIDINTGELILETKYNSIQYLRSTSDFLVGSNNKKGIISADKSTKVEVIYDNIERVTDQKNIFYVVKKSNFYGLLDKDGKTIIYPEYEQIGIDVSAYSQNGVTNGYIFYNEVVPVRRNNKWGLININGNKIVDFIYDSYGCLYSKNNAYMTYGVIEVLDYKLLVVNKSGKYNLVTIEGKELFNGYILDDVYITVSEGKKNYYVTTGSQTTELLGFLKENEEKLGITKVEQ